MTNLPAQPAAPVENVGRGTLAALLAIPVGVIVWVLIWSIGFIASVVSFGVAILAMFLYRLGAGGTIGRAGAVRVTIITLVTIGLSIFAGLVADVAIGIGQVAQVSPFEALNFPQFWEVYSQYVADNTESLTPSILISIAFGILGCFSVLRGAFKATAAPAAPATQPIWPQNPVTPAVDEQAPITPQPLPPVEENPPR